MTLTQLSYDVTDAEKAQAEKSLIAFDRSKKLLVIAINHLNIMYTPFKDHPDISEEQIHKFRAALRDYRDRVIENFNQFKNMAFRCITLMQIFSSDTQTFKLMKSFISSVDDLEDDVNDFSEIFNDLKSEDFVKNITASIDAIKKDTEEIKEIIDDRIKNHIQSNILGRTWVDGVSDSLQVKVEKQDPLLIDLFHQRQEMLSGKKRE